MVAAPAVMALGAVVGRTVAIRPNGFDDFTVVPNQWGTVIARPGWMKSGAVDEGVSPLRQLAAAAREAHEQAKAAEDVKRDVLEAAIVGLKEQMKAAAKKRESVERPGAELAAKKQALAELETPERRYFTQDATIEKLGELLRDNPRGLLVLRDELSGWLRTLDKAGREGDRQFYLEAWNGTGSYTADRVGRGTIHIPALTLSLFGGIQPG
jgi:putative DNA primase/helicase